MYAVSMQLKAANTTHAAHATIIMSDVLFCHGNVDGDTIFKCIENANEGELIVSRSFLPFEGIRKISASERKCSDFCNTTATFQDFCHKNTAAFTNLGELIGGGIFSAICWHYQKFGLRAHIC